MKILLAIVLIAFLTSEVSFAHKGRGGYIEAIESCNLYIENLLSKITKKHEELDPYYTYNNTLTFSKNVLFVNVKGEAQLFNVSIEGIKGLRRVSPCSLSLENGRYKLKANLQSPGLIFSSHGSVKYMNMRSPVTINGRSSTLDVNLAFTVKATAGDEILLDGLKVWGIRDLMVSVGGLKLMLGTLDEVLVDPATEFFKHATREMVSLVLGGYVLDEMTRHPFALDDFELGEDELPMITVLPTTSPDEDNNPQKDRTEFIKEDAVNYMDSVLQNRFLFEAAYAKLDPYTLWDDRIENAFWKDSDMQEKAKANLDLTNGYLHNLSKAKRRPKCTRPVLRSTNVTFACCISFDKLELKYNFRGNHLNLTDFDLIGTVTNTKLSIKVTSNLKDNIPTLKKFAVHTIGNVSVKAAYGVADSMYHIPQVFDQNQILEYFSSTVAGVLKERFRDILTFSIFKTPFDFLDKRS